MAEEPNLFQAIVSNKCPYCGAQYGIKWGGCEAKCAKMQEHQRIINSLIAALEKEDNNGTYH